MAGRAKVGCKVRAKIEINAKFIKCLCLDTCHNHLKDKLRVVSTGMLGCHTFQGNRGGTRRELEGV